MKCIICNSESNYYFSKKYSDSPFDKFMKEIGGVDYYKCKQCGFVLSKTHSELDENEWSRLNRMFHHFIESPIGGGGKVNQPPYAEQAMMLSFLGRHGIVSIDSIVDYAAGYGTLSNILAIYHNIELPIFDPYIQAEDSDNKYLDEEELQTYKTVINSAMFEHVLRRDNIDQVNSLVDRDGCLIIHTVVCENVPNDPNWFYLYPPVHTAFHTNKSMEILMSQWGYRTSIYCPQSKCWVLLRDNIDVIEKKVTTLNQELKGNWFYCKSGFVDYWKGF